MIQINWKKILTYAVSLLIPLGLGALTGYLISGSMDYAMLNKPPLAPPPFLFPVAWSLLYLLMGISYGILRTRGLADTAVNTAYFGQLAVNLLWPVFFFVLKWRLFAFIWIAVLVILVIVMAIRFYQRQQIAGLLQLPYIAWTLFASYLNLSMYLLNK